MSESIINQLKEYAMVTADDMQIDNTDGEFTEEMQAGFERAMEYSEVICPVCWVKDNQLCALNVSNKSETTDLYICEKCGFSEELEKA